MYVSLSLFFILKIIFWYLTGKPSENKDAKSLQTCAEQDVIVWSYLNLLAIRCACLGKYTVVALDLAELSHGVAPKHHCAFGQGFHMRRCQSYCNLLQDLSSNLSLSSSSIMPCFAFSMRGTTLQALVQGYIYCCYSDIDYSCLWCYLSDNIKILTITI